MSGSNQIKVGAILSYIAIAVNIIAGLIYTPWMVGMIGQSQYGLYTLANSLITLFLIDFGLSSATARYLSKHLAENDNDGAEKFLGAIYKLYLIVDAVILIILTVIFFLIDKIYVNLTPTELDQFKIVYMISALFSVINFPFITFNGILTAYEKFIPLKLIDIIYRVFNVGFTVIALLFGGGLYTLVTVNVLVGLFVLLIKFIAIKSTTPIKINFKFKDKNIYKEIFAFSVWVTISSLAQRLIFNITPSILGIVANSTAIAIFGIIVTIEGYTYTFTTAINGMFMPKISRLVTKGDCRNDISKLLITVGKFQYALNGLIIVGFATLGKAFIFLWMGNDFSLAYYGILLVIIPGLFFNTLQIANTTMVVENKVKLLAIVAVITGITNVILSFPLSSKYGVIGACIAICIAYMLRAIIMNIISYKVLKLDIPLMIKKCYIKMSFPIILSIVVGIILNKFISEISWMIFLGKATAIIFIYLTTTFLLALEKKERQQILNIIKKIKSTK